MEKEKSKAIETDDTKSSYPESHGAHSGFRTGISDYNDGANVTDYLGNDDQNQNFGTFDSGVQSIKFPVQ